MLAEGRSYAASDDRCAIVLITSRWKLAEFYLGSLERWNGLKERFNNTYIIYTIAESIVVSNGNEMVV
jgi:hypothetical protein